MVTETTTESAHDVGSYKPIAALVVFLLTNILVVFPFRIPLPNPLWLVPEVRRGPRLLKVPIGMNTVPLLAVLLLLAMQVIDGTTIRKGILGADGIKPIDIMALFISLAYISISLDATGLLRFLAFYLVSKSASGKKLYMLLYLLFFGFGVVVGNDPVILSGTAFLAYMTRVAGITPPTAWIYAQFAAANIASTVLVSSNPTNLVLTGAFGVSFTSYTANVILPAVTSAVLLFPYLLWLFSTRTSPSMITLKPPLDIPNCLLRKQRRPSQELESLPHPANGQAQAGSHLADGVAVRDTGPLIPPVLHASDLPLPSSALVDRGGAKFGSALLIVTLGVLLGTSAAGVHVEVWSITVPAAAVMFIRDVWWDVWGRRDAHSHNRSPAVGAPSTPAVEPVEDRTSDTRDTPSEATRIPETFELRSVHSAPPSPHRNSLQLSGCDNNFAKPIPSGKSPAKVLSWIQRKFPTPCTVVTRLPLALVPFAFSMFILVQALGHPWIAVFASWWAKWVDKTGVTGAVFGMYVATVAGCNFMGTNIGATILLARVVQLWINTSSPPSRTAKGAVYALALGSNYGAFSATFSASLAGLLWKNILNQKGIKVRQSEFAKLNWGMNLVAMVGGCAVLLAQVFVVDH